jgi:transposase InsO family protein
VKLLNKYNVMISMTEGGNPRENAIAERVNGILKTEWLNVKTTATLTETSEFVCKIIGLYNHQRPHQSIGYRVPEQVHQTGIKTDKKWKNYF